MLRGRPQSLSNRCSRRPPACALASLPLQGAAELGRSPLRFAPGGTRELSSELLVSPPLRGEPGVRTDAPSGHGSTRALNLGGFIVCVSDKRLGLTPPGQAARAASRPNSKLRQP